MNNIVHVGTSFIMHTSKNKSIMNRIKCKQGTNVFSFDYRNKSNTHNVFLPNQLFIENSNQNWSCECYLNLELSTSKAVSFFLVLKTDSKEWKERLSSSLRKWSHTRLVEARWGSLAVSHKLWAHPRGDTLYLNN